MWLYIATVYIYMQDQQSNNHLATHHSHQVCNYVAIQIASYWDVSKWATLL